MIAVVNVTGHARDRGLVVLQVLDYNFHYPHHCSVDQVALSLTEASHPEVEEPQRVAGNSQVNEECSYP